MQRDIIIPWDVDKTVRVLIPINVPFMGRGGPFQGPIGGGRFLYDSPQDLFADPLIHDNLFGKIVDEIENGRPKKTETREYKLTAEMEKAVGWARAMPIDSFPTGTELTQRRRVKVDTYARFVADRSYPAPLTRLVGICFSLQRGRVAGRQTDTAVAFSLWPGFATWYGQTLEEIFFRRSNPAGT